MADKDDIKVEGFDENQFDKPSLRKEIDAKRVDYLAKGGTIKKYIPPFQEGNFYHCDTFVTGEGSSASKMGITDTMPRKPRPEKKFGKK